MTKIKMIACDLDGTLLRDGAQALREDTCPLIHELQKKGIRFMPASGRQFDNLRLLFEPIRDEIAYLCQNGASGWADGKTLFCEYLDPDTVLEVIEDMKRFPDFELLISDFDTCYIESGREAFMRHMRDVVRVRAEFRDDLTLLSNQCDKLSIYEPEGLSDIPYWENRYGDRLTVVAGGAQWLDFMGKGIHKGYGLQRMLEQLPVQSEEVLVFGDNLNDLEIMRMAGASVTVESGVDQVKKEAGSICVTVEDALNEILEGKDQIEDWKK